MLRFFKRLRTYRSSIHFIYAEPYRYYGSTVMGGQQLSEIAQKALAQSDRVHFTSADNHFKHCILVLTKWAILSLGHKQLRRLKKRHNRLIFNAHDVVIPADKLKYADVVMAVSDITYKNYKKKLPPSIKTVLVDHNVDPRLKTLDWSKRPNRMHAGYFGETTNTFLTPKIAKKVDIIPVDTVNQNDYWLKELPKYNLHYAIRRTRDVYPNKSFLKGFTAAYCGANILIQDSEKEAIRWLGKDYPYLLRGKVTEKKILEMLEYVKNSFGSEEWERGLEIMRGIKEKTSEEAIGKQLVELFTEVGRGGSV